MTDSRWWFVRRDGDVCEVQLLDEHGRAAAFVRFSPGATVAVVNGQAVPEPVVRLAKNCELGGGQYADSDGRLLDWMGYPLQ